jgi:hypothetical protein
MKNQKEIIEALNLLLSESERLESHDDFVEVQEMLEKLTEIFQSN